MNLTKFIATNRFLRHSPFYWWWRVMNHNDFRLDDFAVTREFWSAINQGWELMKYVESTNRLIKLRSKQ